MGRKMIEVVCMNPACGKPHPKAQSEVNRSMKLGRGFYCCRSCSVTHANEFLGRKAKEETRTCEVCGVAFQVLNKAKSRVTCSDECADTLRYKKMDLDSKERQREAGRQTGNLSVAASLKSREMPKYAKLIPYLKSRGVNFEFEAEIGPYVVDLCLPDHGIVVEFDGPYHSWHEVVASDAQRDNYLTRATWRVFRIGVEAGAVIAPSALAPLGL